MNATLFPGIDWVGFVDWNVRDFHGYETSRGSTYNAYLVRDDKNVLVDTVKAPFAENLLANVKSLLPLQKLDYIVCNHAEPDHAGALGAVLKAAQNAVVVCNEKCREILSKHTDVSTWKFRIVLSGETMKIGKRSLTFVDTPMVHWPESMATYVNEDRLLFSMDAFGQHYASSRRFDDEEPFDVVMTEAKIYYANIVMLYAKNIQKALDTLANLEISVIAPSHGVIWRKNPGAIISAYKSWVSGIKARKVLVIYDTMWQSTDRMARAIIEGASITGVEAKLLHARMNGLTSLATEVLDAAAIAFGSPTLNMMMMPSMAALLTYLKGLKPMDKSGFAFGAYGWSKSGGAPQIRTYLDEMKFEILRETLMSQYAPTPEILEECRLAGKKMAEKALAVGK